MAAAMASSVAAVNAAKEGGVGAADSDGSDDVVIVGVVRASSVPPWTEPVVSVGGGGVEYVMRTVHMVLSLVEAVGVRRCVDGARTGQDRGTAEGRTLVGPRSRTGQDRCTCRGPLWRGRLAER